MNTHAGMPLDERLLFAVGAALGSWVTVDMPEIARVAVVAMLLEFASIEEERNTDDGAGRAIELRTWADIVKEQDRSGWSW
jgi:hypothetical protein